MCKKRYVAIILVAVSLVFSSCYKVEETIALISVKNEQGSAVPGAEVRLYNGMFDTIQVTNGSGVASFNFSDYYQPGQSGFAVLNVEVVKGGLIGSGIINVSEQVTTSEEYVIE